MGLAGRIVSDSIDLYTCNKHEVFPCTKPDGFPDASWENHKQDLLIASRELTYPTWGKGTSSSKVPTGRGHVIVPRRVLY